MEQLSLEWNNRLTLISIEITLLHERTQAFFKVAYTIAKLFIPFWSETIYNFQKLRSFDVLCIFSAVAVADTFLTAQLHALFSFTTVSGF